MISHFELCLPKILCFTLKQGRQGVRNPEQEGQCLCLKLSFSFLLTFNNCLHRGNPLKYGTSVNPTAETQTLFLTSECRLQRGPK